MTRDEQRWLSAYKRAGYTQVFHDEDTGELIPAYHDWVLASAVDALDAGYRADLRVRQFLIK